MNVNINSLGRNVQKQHAGRELALHNVVAVSLFKSAHARKALYISSVDEKVLHGSVFPPPYGLYGVAVNMNAAKSIVNRNK